MTVLFCLWILLHIFPTKMLADERQWDGLQFVQQPVSGYFCGSEPATEEAFRSLQQQGIRTIASVDGIPPQTELAAQYGMRYVHIPMGYDGISEEQSGMLTRLADEADGPIYLHCHHGHHRGPAATAVVCMAAGRMTSAEAAAFLQKSGTNRDYRGLWRDVAAYRRPAAGTSLPALVAVAKTTTLAQKMAMLSRQFEKLQQDGRHRWHEHRLDGTDSISSAALLVQEGLRESDRTSAGTYDDVFDKLMRRQIENSLELKQSLQSRDYLRATECLQKLSAGCKQCHRQFRN
ncbi:MAG: hypothetical protein ACPGXX_17500 [Planctomycetaceae bacterium]